MDAVVMECNGNQAVVLKRDGTFATVRNYHYLVGDEIQISAQKMAWKKPLLSAACLLLVIGLGAAAWCTPYSYVGMEAGYSVEYTLNRFEYVIGTSVNNDDDEVLTEEFLDSMKNQKIEKAVAASIEFADDEEDVRIHILSQSTGEEARLQENLESDEQLSSKTDIEYGEDQDYPVQVSRRQQQTVILEEDDTDDRVSEEENKDQNVVNENVIEDQNFDAVAVSVNAGAEKTEPELVEPELVKPEVCMFEEIVSETDAEVQDMQEESSLHMDANRTEQLEPALSASGGTNQN